MSESIALEKAIKFALRIVALYKYLTETKHEYVLSKQILLSGSHIAKHVKTALHSHRFSVEMTKALEKALDTELWLLLLKEGESISETQYDSLNGDCIEMIKLTSSISKTSRTNE
ncbi:MAG TPA: four helix bundle protein [Pyrinomonadaceae bacterium]|nr:four helix bundle protein [Pyrinomonadaceae bacterium]